MAGYLLGPASPAAAPPELPGLFPAMPQPVTAGPVLKADFHPQELVHLRAA